MLSHSNIIGFISSANLNIAKIFYVDKLGLKLNKADEYALEFDVNGIKLRITQVEEVGPASFTVLGWEVADIASTVRELTHKGVKFEQFDGLNQDEARICTFPGGSKVAWFKDPDGNTLSLTQF